MVRSQVRCSPRFYWLVMAFVAFNWISTYQRILAGTPPSLVALFPAISIGVLMLMVVLLCRRIETTLDNGILTVHRGFLKHRIPLEQLASFRPASYRSWSTWAFGAGITNFRLGNRWYVVPGGDGQAVQLVLRNGRQIMVAVPDPEAFCRAIEEHRDISA